MNVNKKTYNLYIRATKTFSLIILGFSKSASWPFRTIIKSIKITYLMKSIMKMITFLNLRKIKITISKTTLIGKIVSAINLKKIKLIIIAKIRTKIISVIYYRLKFSFVSKARQKLISIIKTGKLSFVLTPVLATFFTLSVYDPQTLGTLDTLTLGQMDFTS